MATATFIASTAATDNQATYASAAFTPSAGTVLAVIVHASDTADAGALTSSASLTFHEEIATTNSAGGDAVRFYVAEATATAVSQTVTADFTGDDATGCVISIYELAGVDGDGADCVEQSASNNGVASGGNLVVTMAGAVTTTNPVIAAVFNNAGADISTPSGLTLDDGDGYSTPTTFTSAYSADSGITASSFDFGSPTGGQSAGLVVEFIDEADAPAATTKGRMMMMGAG